jgi:hypothetical protein
MGRRRLRAAILLSSLALAACAPMPPAHPVVATFAGHPINTSVDSPVARFYLEHGARDHARHHADAQHARWQSDFDAVHASLGDRLPTTADLAQWTRALSADTAALIFARQLARAEAREPLARQFRDAMARPAALPARLEDAATLFLFVPGWLYRSDTSTGADFAHLRAPLAARGARTELLATAENGAIEANAVLIAQRVRALHAQEPDTQVVLVSASKGGPEVAQALTLLRDDPAAARVGAWVNVGGLLAGSALAETGLSWPIRWIVRWMALPESLFGPESAFDGLRSMTPARSAQRARQQSVPPHVLVVSYVAVPLSGQVTPPLRDGYARLRELGPNDGLTLLADAVAPAGVVMAEFGADHYLRAVDMEAKTIALAAVITRRLREDRLAGLSAAPR